jgi:HD superfamily phosphohydrolase
MAKQYEIRDPIHGFVTLNEWERDIINLPAFQRLRRIRQLSLTDMVYPGAMHTRFEHSLGVMHVVTRMFDSLVTRERDFLKSESKG